MKKTITILLLTALCVTVFTSCDLGNGLVAELFGDIRDEYDYGYVEPPADVYESANVAIDPIEPWGTVEIETAPPMPETTEEYTVEEYWSEDVIIEPTVPLTQIMYSVVYQVDCEYISGCEIFTESLFTNYNHQWVDPNDVTVEQGCESLIVSGILGLTNAHYARFGYSINGGTPYYTDAYQRDPDPEIKEQLFNQGADYVSEYQVYIPLADLPAGSYEITVWYANYNNEALLATNVEDQVCIFNLEIAQPIMD